VGEAFASEMTAEQLTTKRNKYGVPTKRWEQIRDRNESLDCFVLALAALRIIAPTPVRFASLAAKIAAPPAPAPPVRPATRALRAAVGRTPVPLALPVKPAVPHTSPHARRITRSGYLGQ
jgi:phage terminase large subunit GpA-like protein